MNEEQKKLRREFAKKQWEDRKKNPEIYSEVCKKMSDADKGRVSPFKGKSNPSLIGNTNAKGLIPWNKGIPMDDKTKEKVSKSKLENPTKYWLGKKRPEMKEVEGFNRTGISPWNKDKICPQLSKENHWNWKNGISEERHSFYFKQLSKKLRVNACCINCSSTEDLVVHHLNEMKQDNRIENLVVLCRSCHGYFHSMRMPMEVRI